MLKAVIVGFCGLSEIVRGLRGMVGGRIQQVFGESEAVNGVKTVIRRPVEPTCGSSQPVVVCHICVDLPPGLRNHIG